MEEKEARVELAALAEPEAPAEPEGWAESEARRHRAACMARIDPKSSAPTSRRRTTHWWDRQKWSC